MRDHIFSRASSLYEHPCQPSTPSNPQAYDVCPNSLVLPNSLPNAPEPICHNARDAEEIVGGTETADGEIAAVLDGFVAAGWRHVLRHVGRCARGVGGWWW